MEVLGRSANKVNEKIVLGVGATKNILVAKKTFWNIQDPGYHALLDSDSTSKTNHGNQGSNNNSKFGGPCKVVAYDVRPVLIHGVSGMDFGPDFSFHPFDEFNVMEEEDDDDTMTLTFKTASPFDPKKIRRRFDESFTDKQGSVDNGEKDWFDSYPFAKDDIGTHAYP